MKFDHHNDFIDPILKTAPSKTFIDTVISGFLTVGNGLVTLVSSLLAVSLTFYAGYALIDTFNVEYKAYSSSWDLLKYKPDLPEDYEAELSGSDMTDINPDYRAWITLYETSIDYPVLQGEDDLYYAWHNVYRESSLTGSIYLAAANDPDCAAAYNLMYGHHMDNGAMFGRLDSYKDSGYFDAHRTGVLITSKEVYDLEAFALITTDAYESRVYTVGSKDNVMAFLRSGGEGGVGVGTNVLHYDAEIANQAEQVLALSTCASAETYGRLVLFLKMTPRKPVVLTAAGYTGVYDGKTHLPKVSADRKDAVITYSLDDGKTWVSEMPSITDVGKIPVKVRAETPSNGTVEAEIVLEVTPRPVTVTVRNSAKFYGTDDPTFTADVNGLLGDDTIKYTISRTNSNQENVGEYDDVLVARGKEFQGNYQITYIPGDFEIVRAGGLNLRGYGYRGYYDGDTHYATYDVSVKEGTTIEFSTDGGKTWSKTVPGRREPGETKVLIRATNPNYETEQVEVKLEILAVTTVTIVKQWENDTPANRPASLTMSLVCEESAYNTTVELTRANNWEASVTIPDGLSYQWNEPECPGYDQVSKTENNGVTTIVNRLRKKTVKIVKQWENDTPADRPASCNMAFKCEGYNQIVVLNAGNRWQASLTIPDGLSYQWVEPDCPGYDQVSRTEKDGVTTIVNRLRFHQLTIRYVDEEGNELKEPQTEDLHEGEKYSFKTPRIDGYVTETKVVSGIMGSSDLVVTVVYHPGEPETHVLTIRFVDEEGNELQDEQTETLEEGEDYSFSVPQRIGERVTSVTDVDGTMGDQDLTVTVVYVPDMIQIGEYRIPLGISRVYMQEGDCYE